MAHVCGRRGRATFFWLLFDVLLGVRQPEGIDFLRIERSMDQFTHA